MAGEKKGGSAKAAGGATIEGVAEEQKKKKRTSPAEFLRQVRVEAEKVSWTSWKETWVSTLMVLTMVVIMAVFFLLVDQTIRFIIDQTLRIGA